jgi:hypothetical protein
MIPYDHDCIRCKHHPGLVQTLMYVDDLELWCPRGTSPQCWEAWTGLIVRAHQPTAIDIPLEHDPRALQEIDRQIIALRAKIVADERERIALYQTLEETRLRYTRAGARIGQMIQDVLAIDENMDFQQRARELKAEQERIIPEIQLHQRSLFNAEDDEKRSAEELHILRLRRGCSCCNPALLGGSAGSASWQLIGSGNNSRQAYW